MIYKFLYGFSRRSIKKLRNVIQAAQYSHTNTHTKVVQLDYTYTHLWCGAHTVLGPYTFKLEFSLYNCTLGSAR